MRSTSWASGATFQGCCALATRFVAPTRYEAFGLAVLEALCCGLPSLVTRDAGVAERYPATLDDLLLDDPEDAAELTGKLRGLLTRRDHWKKTMRSVSKDLRTHTWEDMARGIWKILARQ